MSILEENWKIQLNTIEEDSYSEFETKVECINEHVIYLIENGFKIQKSNYSSGYEAQTHDNELKNLIERNKQLRLTIDMKLEELSRQTKQYENYKKDQKLLSQEIKETHEAFLMAKKYYKKFLKMYYTIESKNGGSQKILVQFFTESKKESENYSVHLLKDLKTGHYSLSNVTPKLQILSDLQKILKETNDVPGALCCVRQEFAKIKMNKKH